MSTKEEVAEKLSTLGAYTDDIKEEIRCLKETKKEVITLRSEVDQLKKEAEDFWKLHTDFDKTKVRHNGRIQSIDEKQGKILRKIRDIKDDFKDLEKFLEMYPEIRDSYKQLKKIVIGAIVMIVLAALGITVGLNIYLG